MRRSNAVTLAALFVSLTTLGGRQDLVPRDAPSLLIPEFQRSEIASWRGWAYQLPERRRLPSFRPPRKSPPSQLSGGLAGFVPTIPPGRNATAQARRVEAAEDVVSCPCDVLVERSPTVPLGTHTHPASDVQRDSSALDA
jgi:hypothetical protein